jgi:hypothetical protein
MFEKHPTIAVDHELLITIVKNLVQFDTVKELPSDVCKRTRLEYYFGVTCATKVIHKSGSIFVLVLSFLRPVMIFIHSA